MVEGDRGETEQVVAQRLGDELVDLVADLSGHAAHDGAACSGRRAAGGELERIEEGRDQPVCCVSPLTRLKSESKRSTVSSSIEVAEAINDVRELGDDRRIDRRIVPCPSTEDIDLRLDFARNSSNTRC